MIAFISPCPLARLVAGAVAHGLSFAQLNFRGGILSALRRVFCKTLAYITALLMRAQEARADGCEPWAGFVKGTFESQTHFRLVP
jgi:hypothetical protein